MSESDDTDVLLLIPPDIFHVPSSDSDTNSVRTDCARTGVISELVGHMQSLESRISAIESKDNSLDVSALNNLLDSQLICSSPSYRRQTLPRTRFAVSQGASLQHTPVKVHKSLSLPSTPSRYSRTDSSRNEMRPECYLPTVATSNSTNINALTRTKHGALISCSDSSVVLPASCGTGLSHATAMSTKRESHLSLRPNDRTNTNNLCYKPTDSWHSALSNASTGQQHTRPRIVQDMELSEVNELLHEMEATELKLSKRINSGYHNEPIYSTLSQTVDSANQEKDAQHKFGTHRKLDFLSCDKEANCLPVFSQKKSNDAFPDISLSQSDSFHLNETDRMTSEFKTWEQSVQQPSSKSNGYRTESINSTNNLDLFNVSYGAHENAKPKETIADQNILSTSEASKASTSSVHVHCQSKPSAMNAGLTPRNSESMKFSSMPINLSTKFSLLNLCKTPQHKGNIQDDGEKSEFTKSTAHVGTNTDLHLRYFILLI